MPGGFGAAKNLSTFAFKGAELEVDGEMTRVLQDFHKEKKAIGLCCIAPVIAAKVFPGATLTLGKRGEGWPYEGSLGK